MVLGKEALIEFILLKIFSTRKEFMPLANYQTYHEWFNKNPGDF